MKSLLKFITCGSVDDGKSTLIGHMLYDAKLLFADQEKTLELDSKVGSAGGEMDYSLLLDGLMAEREQGITIDVAYRYFTTEKRSFIVADTPGHEEYTRNMAVGASFADLAVILIDASAGLMTQTKRHIRICALMGIEHIVFAVNKMDVIKYQEQIFLDIENDINDMVKEFTFKTIKIIPVSAKKGDNLTNKSKNMAWYQEGTLLEYLETIDVSKKEEKEELVLPVQRVCRPDRNFRGFQGEISAGRIKVGQKVYIYPNKEQAKIKKIFVTDKEGECGVKGQAVTVQLNREVDVSRGCVISSSDNLTVSNIFNAKILWLDDTPLIEGKNYYLKIGTKILLGTVMKIKYKIDVNEGNHLPVKILNKNEIASCDIILNERIVINRFEDNKELGAFILIDRVSNMTSACGVVEHTLRRGDNIVYHKMDIDRTKRAASLNQNPKSVWFTGLSGAGKSTLVNEVEKRLFAKGKHTMVLDGDNVRLGLNKNLGFEEKDRIENIRRNAEVCRLMNDAGLIVLTALVAPYQKDRDSARNIIGEDSFVEVYVSTSLEVCKKRDVKGLYQKAQNNEIPNFTGVSAPYEVPCNPDIIVDTEHRSIEETVNYIMQELERYQL